VPFYWQDTEYTCGPASLQMVFAFFKKRISEEALAKKLKTSKEFGTYRRNLTQYARREGFYCYVNNNGCLSELFHYVSIGFPAIVNIMAEGGGHFCVVVGATKNEIIVNDPYYGAHKKMNIDEFEKNWKGERNNSKKWMLVLSQENLRLGKQYHPILK